jgi:hypothetical protein
MRFLTILISIFVGVVLCAIFIGNGHGVLVNLEPFVARPAPPATPYRVMPLWVVMISCAGIGVLLGYLLGVTSGYHSGPPVYRAPDAVKKAEKDYLLVNAPVDRRGS